MSHDWMPGKYEDKLSMAKQWVDTLLVRGPEWNVSALEIAELSALTEATAAALEMKQVNGGGTIGTAAIRDALKAMVAFMRRLKKTRFFSPPLNEADLASLGLKLPDLIPTKRDKVRELVDLTLSLHNPREIIVNFRVKDSSRRAKPRDYVGVLIRYAILDAPTKSHDKLTIEVPASRTPHTLKFDESQRGKTVYVAAAWLNARGILGSWSEIRMAIIP